MANCERPWDFLCICLAAQSAHHEKLRGPEIYWIVVRLCDIKQVGRKRGSLTRYKIAMFSSEVTDANKLTNLGVNPSTLQMDRLSEV